MTSTRSSRKPSLARSMSFSHRNLNVGKISDNRLIKDPNFQAEIRKDLTNFFFTHQADFFSVKCLSNPLRQDFENMLRYVLLTIEPNTVFSASSNIFLAEAYDLVKKLYPFQVSKTHFDSAGAKHSWPNLLAMLHYLMIISEEKAEIVLTAEEEEYRFDMNSQCYNLYINNTGDELDEKTNELIHEEETKMEKYDSFIASCEEEALNLDTDIHNYHKTSTDISEEIQTGKDLEVQVDVLRARINTIKSTISSNDSTKKEFEEKVATLQSKEHSLQEKVSNQPLSKGSAKKIVKNTRSLREKLALLEQQAASARKTCQEYVTKRKHDEQILLGLLDEIKSIIGSKADIFSPIEKAMNAKGMSIEGLEDDVSDKITFLVSYKSLHLNKELYQLETEIDKKNLKVQTLMAAKVTPVKGEGNFDSSVELEKKKKEIATLNQVLKQLKKEDMILRQEVKTKSQEADTVNIEQEALSERFVQAKKILEKQEKELVQKVIQLDKESNQLIENCMEEYSTLLKDIKTEKQSRKKLLILNERVLKNLKKSI